MLFEWDLDKAKKNLKERGIDFEDGPRVFLDPYRIEKPSPRNDEDRYAVIAKIEDVIFFLVYVDRVYPKIGEVRRIISFRRASEDERNKYEKDQES